MGWRSRAPILGGHERAVVGNGVFRPFALVGGRGAATWSLAGTKLVLTPFAPLASTGAAALEAEATNVVRYLGERGSPTLELAS